MLVVGVPTPAMMAVIGLAILLLSAPIRSATSPPLVPLNTLPVTVAVASSVTALLSALAVGTSSTMRTVSVPAPCTAALDLSVTTREMASVLSVAPV